MTVRYHINKHGNPGVCKAKKGNCPYGDEGAHFGSLKDAEEEAHRRGEAEFNIIEGIERIESEESSIKTPQENKKKSREKLRKEREALNRKKIQERYNEYKNKREEGKENKTNNVVKIHRVNLDLEDVNYPKGNTTGRKPKGRGSSRGLLYIDYVKEEFERERVEAAESSEAIPYYFRLKESNRIGSRMKKGKNTFHYNVERKGRRTEIDRLLGRGEVVGNYLIHHDVSEMGQKEDYEWQIAEVKDTGQVTIYSERTKRAITTFIPSEAKMKAIIVKAGEVPNKDFLETVAINRDIWNNENRESEVNKSNEQKWARREARIAKMKKAEEKKRGSSHNNKGKNNK